MLRRRESGFSLMFVISLGAIAALGAMATADLIMPAYRDITGQSRGADLGRIAEDAANYAVSTLNQNPGGLPRTSVNLPLPSSISGNATVTVQILPLDTKSGSLKNSPILNLSNDGTNFSNDYRQILVVAKNGTALRSITLIVGPNNFNISTLKQPTNNVLFDNALFANGTLTITDNTSVLSATGPTAANISSFQQIKISGASQINGSINAASTLTPSLLVPPLSSDPASNLIVTGNVHTMSSFASVSGQNQSTPFAPTDAFSPTSNSPLLADSPGITSPNVLGNAIVDQQGVVDDSVSISSKPAAPVQTNIVPGQLSSTGSQTVASPSASSSSSTSSTSQSSNLGAISLNSGDSISFNPGSYVVSSLQAGQGSTVNILSGSSAQASPVQIYIQGSSASDSAINLSAKMTGNTNNPQNFQIYYNGFQPVNISLPDSSVNALIYAPNADVTLDTRPDTSKPANNFTGAIVANSMTLKGGGSLTYSTGGTTPTIPTQASQNGTVLPNSYSVLSWKESNF